MSNGGEETQKRNSRVSGQTVSFFSDNTREFPITWERKKDQNLSE
jgi:hypothetical protein